MDGKLDPKTTALVVIDLQKGIANMGRQLMPYDANSVIANAMKLAERFRRAGGTVVLVHVNTRDGKDMLKPPSDVETWSKFPRPADFSEFIDSLKPEGSDIEITKRQWGAFYGTELDLQLRRRGIKTIVLCGVSTNIGVETTAREAYQHGYEQLFAEDAMAAMSDEEHNSSVKFIFPRIGRVRKTQQILEML